MSAGESEPEKYSIDEMMERLKTRPSGDPATDGELVIREDGTQAMKVRKRKRRSQQPQKEKAVRQRRMRVVQIVSVMVLLMVIAVAAVSIFVYANSAPYRKGIIAKVTSSTGANVELQQFRVNPVGANAESASFTWPAGNALKSVTLRGISADVAIASFLGSAWTGDEVLAREGEVHLAGPQSGADLVAQALPDGKMPVDFNRLGVAKLNMLLGDKTNPSIKLLGTEASFYPRNVAGRPELRLNRGELKIANWPAFRLDRARMEFRGQITDVIGIRLFDESDELGYFELSGMVNPFTPEEPSTLNARLEGFPIGTVVGADLGRIFSGRIDSREIADSNYLTFTTGGDSAAKLVLSVRSGLASRIEFAGIPALLAISRALEDDWFEHPVFENEAVAVIRRDIGSVSITEIAFESKSRMAVRGEIHLAADQKLRGKLRIGLADAMISTAPSAALAGVFTESSEGFRWVDLVISGTGAQPLDNFKELYEAALAEAQPGTPKDGGDDFEDLTRPR